MNYAASVVRYADNVCATARHPYYLIGMQNHLLRHIH